MDKINTRLKPYFDDYDESKGYHTILFRPSYAVQTRELNQIQTLFQKQVERFGNHVFKNGSVVIPGAINHDNEYRYVKVTLNNYSDIVDRVLQEIDLRLVTQSNGLIARVMEAVDTKDEDPFTFYVRYTNSGNSGELTKFEVNDAANIVTRNDELIGTAVIEEVGKTSRAVIDDGVYFVEGKFVLVPKQSIRLAKYNNAPNVSVGLLYKESIVAESQDATLYDNAAGSSNHTAPGAHRLRIDLQLVKYEQDEEQEENFIQLMEIENGQYKQKAREPEYNVLEQTLARRTYEEVGDYTVKPFSIDVKEHLLVPNSGIDGEFLKEEGGEESKYAVTIDPGLAYVRGYRVELLKSKVLSIDKARETANANNTAAMVQYGKYIHVKDAYGLPDPTAHQRITFYSGSVGNAGSVPSGNVLGYANVRGITRGANLRIHLFNFRDTDGNRTSSFVNIARSVYSAQGSFTFSATLDGAYVMGTESGSALVRLNNSYVKSLLDEGNQTDTSYTVLRRYTSVVGSSGEVILTAGGNEAFIPFNDVYSFVVDSSDGKLLEVNSHLLGGNPLGSSITLNVGSGNAGKNVEVVLQLNKQEARQKNKALTAANATGIVADSKGRYYLNHPDVVELISVKDAENKDVTSNFMLNRNDNTDYYGYSYLTSSTTSLEPLSVEYRYFQHGSGDYFSVDSYGSIDYSEIPVSGNSSLSDYIDIRPVVDKNGNVIKSGDLIHDSSIINTDVEYYLARTDKVYVNSEGEFGVVKGTAALEPKSPSLPENSMELATLQIPPYTRNANAIVKVIKHNKRYTMADIGKLENRIENLEYYVTLSLLEQQIANRDIYDSEGLDRFKNGFVVEDFADHSKSDFTNPDYRCSVGAMGNRGNALQAEYTLNALDIELELSGTSNVVIKNGLAMLEYEEVEFLRQRQASSSINVNPYAVFSWEGNITLDPSVDNWIDIVYNEPKVNYSIIENGNLQQSWTSFGLTWEAGVQVNTEVSETTEQIGSRTEVVHREAFVWRRAIGEQTIKTFRDTTTLTTNVENTDVEEIADHLINRVSIPYIRSREIEVDIKAMKPNTRMHFFFDGVNVDQWVKPSNGNYGDKVITDNEGDGTATFKIPNEPDVRFRTGARILEVINQAENKREDSDAYGHATYEAEGVRETRQKELNATRSITSSSISQSEEREEAGKFVRYKDPLAQSFLVETRGGVFVTSIDLFFNEKDDETYPVSVDIRVMENGFPTQNIVPNSEVILKPSEVNTSDDGSVPTTFTFAAPVHLKQGTEYCFVIESNSNKYTVWKATMGEADVLTGQAISEQPFVGVMFKSQNSSTWTEDQLSDLKFVIKRAKFLHNDGVVEVSNTDQDLIPLTNNPIVTYENESYFDVIIEKGHGYIAGGKITLSNLQGGAGISANELNGTHVVSEVLSPIRVRVDANVSANESTRIGGLDGMRSNSILFSAIQPSVEMLNFEGTGTHLMFKGVSGRSYSGDEEPYLTNLPFISLDNKNLNFLPIPFIALDEDEEADKTHGEKSFRSRVVLTTERDNVSPVVDLQRMVFVVPNMLIDHNEDEQVDGENCFAKYISRVFTVDNPTTALQVYVDEYVPRESNLIYSIKTGNSAEELEDTEWSLLHRSQSKVSPGYVEENILKEFDNDFTYFQVMIQMKGKSVVDVPLVRNLRMIALGT